MTSLLSPDAAVPAGCSAPEFVLGGRLLAGRFRTGFRRHTIDRRFGAGKLQWVKPNAARFGPAAHTLT